MATSGTVGSTIIETAKVIDHATRRCGLSPSTLTPEQLDIALDNLYLILQMLYNRGLNLWCIDRQLIGLNPDRTRYDLPAGTIDVLSARLRRGAMLTTASQAVTADQVKATFANAVAVKTVGIYHGKSVVYNLVVEVSNDGSTWAAAKYIPQFVGNAGTWTWFDIDPAYATPAIRIRETKLDTNQQPVQFAQVVMMNSTISQPITAMNRDTYDALPNKTMANQPLQYLFDKLVSPQIVLWPSPNDSYSFLEVTRQRQPMDVGALQDSLEIPQRWYEAIIWKLAEKLAFELPNVDPNRAQLVIGMAATELKMAEDGETDGSPIYLQPQISGYTR